MKLKNLTLIRVTVITFVFTPNLGHAQTAKKEKAVEVGGAAMYPSKNIVENAFNSKDLTPLVAAVKAAGLVEKLQSEGPFSLFAVTNAAFDKLPDGNAETLLKEDNKGTLTAVLIYHVLAGKFNAKDVSAAIKKNKGKAEMKTVSGGTLTFWKKGGDIYVTDENGNRTKVTIADVNQSNGVIQVIDTVFKPK
ncbi:MAG: fasciclin domain-containing protein [Crocinitomicaceae bacterium]|nr:fasciclin domain-containing protein [Crocinitomicaceae bacterium]